jgi:hypothetical protein
MYLLTRIVNIFRGVISPIFVLNNTFSLKLDEEIICQIFLIIYLDVPGILPP